MSCPSAIHMRTSLIVASRIDGIARFMQEDTRIFPLSSVPPHATWGTDALRRRLVVGRREADIWSVGTLKQLLFFTAANAMTTLSVTITLLRESDNDRMLRLLRRSSPKSSTSVQQALQLHLLTHST